MQKSIRGLRWVRCLFYSVLKGACGKGFRNVLFGSEDLAQDFLEKKVSAMSYNILTKTNYGGIP